MAKTQERQQAFTRLAYGFIVSRTAADFPGRDIEDTFLAARTRTFDGSQNISIWEEMREAEAQKHTLRLVLPVVRYFRTKDSARHVLAMSWTANCLDLFGREVRAGESKTASRIFDIKTVELYLFDTSVGILVFEVALVRVEGEHGSRLPGPEDLVALNYLVSAIGPTKECLASVRWTRAAQHGSMAFQTGDDLRDRMLSAGHFDIKELIDWCLRPLAAPGCECTATSQLRLQGLSFLLVSADHSTDPPRARDPGELGTTLFRLRRLYNKNYLPSQPHLDPRHDPEVLQTFDSVFIGTSAEGMAVLVLDDDRTPFYQEIGDRVRHGYFALFLLALHQRVALERLSLIAGSLARLSHDGGSSPAMTPRLIEEVKSLRHRVFDFTLHHRFPFVSTTTVYQAVYERLLENMRVIPLHQGIRDTLAEMDTLLERAREQGESDARRWVDLIIAILAPFGLWLALWSTNFIEIAGLDKRLHSIRGASSIFTACGALMLVGLLLWRSRSRPNK